ncbi:unnamed protein product, partial [Trichogramma brassicae]
RRRFNSNLISCAANKGSFRNEDTTVARRRRVVHGENIPVRSFVVRVPVTPLPSLQSTSRSGVNLGRMSFDTCRRARSLTGKKSRASESPRHTNRRLTSQSSLAIRTSRARATTRNRQGDPESDSERDYALHRQNNGLQGMQLAIEAPILDQNAPIEADDATSENSTEEASSDPPQARVGPRK